jgi:LPXTG-motif cell wall-anchored protein
LKRLMLLAAALAMALTTTVPAVAQVGQENEQEGESGEVDQSFTVTGSGDSANQCAALLGGTQSGNSQNQGNVVQERSASDDLEVDEAGSEVTLSPELAEECEQIINQAAASGASPKAAPGPATKTEEKGAEEKKSEAKASATQAKAEGKKAEEKKAEEKKAEEKKAEEKKELPKTGGSGTASMLALGTGAIFVAGGLLARRSFR